MNMVDNLLERDYLLRKLMKAKINSEGLYLSHVEVCSVLGSILIGSASDSIMELLCFEDKYKVKIK